MRLILALTLTLTLTLALILALTPTLTLTLTLILTLTLTLTLTLARSERFQPCRRTAAGALPPHTPRRTFVVSACRTSLSKTPRPPYDHPTTTLLRRLAAASPVWSPLPRAPARRGEVIVAMALGCHVGPGEQDYTAPLRLVYSTDV